MPNENSTIEVRNISAQLPARIPVKQKLLACAIIVAQAFALDAAVHPSSAAAQAVVLINPEQNSNNTKIHANTNAQSPAGTPAPVVTNSQQIYMIIKGMPYSGLREVHNTFVFPDGEHQDEYSKTMEWRDSEGRTRKDTTYTKSDGMEVTVCRIDDPVALVRYIWKVGPKVKSVVTETHYQMTGIREEIWNNVIYQYQKDPQTGIPERNVITVPTKLPGDTDSEYIDGLYTDVHTQTETIPPGKRKNHTDHAIEVVDKFWFSPDLGLYIKMTHVDPTDYSETVELTNIDRSDPAPSVFQPPAGLPTRQAPETDPVWKEPIG